MEKDLVFSQIDLPKIINTMLREGGEYADIFYEDNRTTNITCEKKRIEKVVAGSDRGVGIRVIKDFHTFYGYTNSVNEESLLSLARDISQSVKGRHARNSRLSAVADTAQAGADMGERTCVGTDSVEHDLRNGEDLGKFDLNEKVSLVKRADKVGWGIDGRIVQVKVIYSDSLRHIMLYNSLGNLVEDLQPRVLFVVQVISADGDVLQTGYEPIGWLGGLKNFEENPPEEVAECAAKRSIMMLSARRIEGGTMPVVISGEAGGTMIHEAIGHGLEADLAGEGLSIYKDRIGEQVASPLISIIDDATLSNQRGSFGFDDEGTKAGRTVLMKNGILKGYMYDRVQALKDGVTSTGNGRRQSYRYRPIVRMTNTFIAPGETSPEQIVKATEKGFFVKKMGGGQVNSVTGDFVFEVREGYLIEKGSIGEPTRGAVLTGNGPSILKQIDMVGNDLCFSVGTCGKDGQAVPVSDAMPTTRILEMVVGGEVR